VKHGGGVGKDVTIDDPLSRMMVEGTSARCWGGRGNKVEYIAVFVVMKILEYAMPEGNSGDVTFLRQTITWSCQGKRLGTTRFSPGMSAYF
jgi:hypothetical protein